MMTTSYLVTGASTGIGRACVNELVRTGAHVWATVRTDEDEKALQREHPEAVTALRMDLTDPDAVRAAGDRVVEAGALNGLVNNAGVALPAPLEYIPIDAFRRQLEVNLVGQLAVTQAMLPALRAAREQGASAHIVLVGSIGGRIAGPMLGPYHASKFGLVGLADSLRAELAPSGIRVVLIEPGAVATPIWRRGTATADDLARSLPPGAERYAGQIERVRANAQRSAARGIPPEQAAKVIVRALTGTNPRPRQVIGRDAKVGAAFARVMPYRLLYRLVAS